MTLVASWSDTTSFAVDEWLMFDDENVSMVTSEDILKLSGGGLSLACRSLHSLQCLVCLLSRITLSSVVI